MRHSHFVRFLVPVLLLSNAAHALDPPQPAAPAKATADSKSPRELSWDDLLPESERDAPLAPQRDIRPLFDDESGPAASQIGSAQVNAKLDGLTVKLPGFVVPLKYSVLPGNDDGALLTEFLLVPYFGACIHVPPPPPNQIVHVKMPQATKVTNMYEPVWVIGKLSAQSMSSELADAAYSITGTKIEKYEER